MTTIDSRLPRCPGSSTGQHHWVKRVVGRQVRRMCAQCNVMVYGPPGPDDPNDPLVVHEEQPAPTPNDYPDVQSAVIADVESRRALGISRYGTALQPFNGRDTLRDAYEEALDLVVYLRGVLEEENVLIDLLREATDLVPVNSLQVGSARIAAGRDWHARVASVLAKNDERTDR